MRNKTDNENQQNRQDRTWGDSRIFCLVIPSMRNKSKRKMLTGSRAAFSLESIAAKPEVMHRIKNRMEEVGVSDMRQMFGL